jgi:N-acyl-D-aspartate/D-glutamate deacylase
VLVGGAAVARDGEFTDPRPGRLVRSGRDTHTPDRATVRDRGGRTG